MTFMASLGEFNAAARTPSPTKTQGLDVAVGEIDAVIKTINAELENLKPDEFEYRGHIKAGSFGGGDRAPDLSVAHTRAHGVTAATLRGVRQDLEVFRQACVDAKNEILAADEDAAGRLRANQSAVDTLTVGSWSDYGDRSHEQAERDHRDDRPTDEPDVEAPGLGDS